MLFISYIEAGTNLVFNAKMTHNFMITVLYQQFHPCVADPAYACHVTQLNYLCIN